MQKIIRLVFIITFILIINVSCSSQEDYYSIYIIFDNIVGLHKNAEVMDDRDIIGRVEDITLVKDKVKVKVRIKRSISITKDAEIIIENKNNDDNKKVIRINRQNTGGVVVSPESILFGKTGKVRERILPKSEMIVE